MNTKILTLFLFSSLLFATSCSVEGGFVTDRPADVYYSRPVAPGPGYMWIDGDWMWSGGAYRWHEGHWGRPRGGRTWQGGHWQSANQGWKWRRGHWR